MSEKKVSADMPGMDASLQQIQMMPVERLLLDAENPRLATSVRGKSQFEIIQVLWTEMAVDELVYSIAANGYFPEEPLFAIPCNECDAEYDADKLVVLEGNRRLAAVLILLKDEWREKLKATNLPSITAAQKEALRSLPVSVYPNREVLWKYLSFRHINSPKAWDSFSKAKYVAHVHDDYQVSLQDIANRIGDRHATVSRLYRGYKVLQQAEAQAGFDQEDRVRNRFYFSHLYTALDYPEFQSFLGISGDEPDKDNPVASSCLGNLTQLMIWLYGSKSESKAPLVQKQNPDLVRLRDAISKPESLEELKAGYSLEIAYNTSVGDEPRFRRALINTRQELKQANQTVATGYDGDESLYLVLNDIQDILSVLQREMKRVHSNVQRRAKR